MLPYFLQQNIKIIVSFFTFSFGCLVFFNSGMTTNTEIEKASRVLILKSERKLILYKENKEIFRCSISLGKNPIGQKNEEGDGRTPEGKYILDWRNPNSKFYKSIHISYPNEADKKRAKAKGVSPGGQIMIHGIKNGRAWIGKLHLLKDWTQGCIAVTNKEMDILWNSINDGTPVEIRK